MPRNSGPVARRTDPMAATVAENAIYETLLRGVEDRRSRDPRDEAVAIVAGLSATFERANGLRRVVLVSAWEVDPAAKTEFAAGQG